MTRSPRRLKQQVQDTVGEQIRDLPLHAVRLAMFGVGRALLLLGVRQLACGGLGVLLAVDGPEDADRCRLGGTARQLGEVERHRRRCRLLPSARARPAR